MLGRLLIKVLNRALDFDARILHPLCFGPLANQLDELVHQNLLDILQVPSVGAEELMTLRLSDKLGGCGIFSAVQK